MDYLDFCNVYKALESTTKGLEKTRIISGFLKKIEKHPEWIYLLQGKVFPDFDRRDLGLSEQLVIRCIARASGFDDKSVVREFKKKGDLGLVAEDLLGKKKVQRALFSKKLSVEKVFLNLSKIPEYVGKGTIEQKIGKVVEVLHSATPMEAKYIVRTILGDLKVGVGSGILRDSIVDFVYSPKNLEEKKKFIGVVQEALDKSNDFAEVFRRALDKTLDRIGLSPKRPVKVMLFPKASDVEDAFRIVGRPAAFEYKYDGFRMIISRDGGGAIRLFTRRLEDVTAQFPEVVEIIRSNVRAKTFMIDCEAVGYDRKSGKYTPFQAISQRIRRKYGIERMSRELPVELVVFDIIYLDGKELVSEEFSKRRAILEKIVVEKRKKIILAKQIVTGEPKTVEKFYEKALLDNQEGLMAKSLTAPYKPGSRIGYAVKLKPEDDDLDLVITGAEWGTGKRAGWLTSFDISCRGDDELLGVGKVSTGLKELEEEGLSFEKMTSILKKLIVSEDGRHVRVRPEVVVSVRFQNIQKSPNYESGFALRFPRIKRLRPDRDVRDIATIEEIEEFVKNVS